jgi:hypothetical protein
MQYVKNIYNLHKSLPTRRIKAATQLCEDILGGELDRMVDWFKG